METIAVFMKLAAVAIASLFVGTPLAPAADDQTLAPKNSAQPSGGAPSSDGDGNQAANKIAAQGSTVEHMVAAAGTQGAQARTTVTLFDEWIKVSDPKDLLIEVNAECALWTWLRVVDDDDTNTPDVDVPASESEARVTVWVELDGQRIGVTEYDPSGEVVFCDRMHGMTLTENDGDEDNETISNYLRTRTANSFSWIATNVGDYSDSIYHNVVVKAELEAKVNEGEAEAEAAVGKRTLIVEPVGLANDETV